MKRLPGEWRNGLVYRHFFPPQLKTAICGTTPADELTVGRSPPCHNCVDLVKQHESLEGQLIFEATEGPIWQASEDAKKVASYVCKREAETRATTARVLAEMREVSKRIEALRDYVKSGPPPPVLS